jgi:hypothetical protein
MLQYTPTQHKNKEKNQIKVIFHISTLVEQIQLFLFFFSISSSPGTHVLTSSIDHQKQNTHWHLYLVSLVYKPLGTQFSN